MSHIFSGSPFLINETGKERATGEDTWMPGSQIKGLPQQGALSNMLKVFQEWWLL